jgi:hypothetical protein
MIKRIVKLAIVALLANAAYRVGLEYLTYIKFRDAIRDAAMFNAKSAEDLRSRIMAIADDYDLALDDDSIEITLDERVWHIDGSYTKPIEIAPRFEYAWPFPYSLEVVMNSVPPIEGGPNSRRPR